MIGLLANTKIYNFVTVGEFSWRILNLNVI